MSAPRGYYLVRSITGTQSELAAPSQDWLRETGSHNLEGDRRQYHQFKAAGTFVLELYERECAGCGGPDDHGEECRAYFGSKRR